MSVSLLPHRYEPSAAVILDGLLVSACDHRNEIEALIKTSQKITELEKTNQDAWRSANFDSLTGIANRWLFFDRLEQTLLEAERNLGCFAVLFVNLDCFKQANDKLGQEGGDRLLAQVAERIGSSVRATDTLARLGGDEFILILKEATRDGAKEAARAILTSLERVFEVNENQINISASIGLTFFPEDGMSVSELLQSADQAVYAAKELGGRQFQVFEPSMAETESDHMRLNRELNEALREGQLEIYYQPIIDIRTGAIIKAEALLRWNHPYKGVLSPADFLSITKHSGMTNKITDFVLKQAVSSSSLWRDQHGEAFPISINESPASFITRSLVDDFRAWPDDISLEDSQITMELTPEFLKTINASDLNPITSLSLPGLRLQLAMDNFGSKPFSPSMLREFRMESIKLDRDLVKNAGKGGDTDDVLKAIIAMAHAINLKVVGVGVEQIEQLRFLTCAGCDYAQGFLFSEPLRRDDFEALLMRGHQ